MSAATKATLTPEPGRTPSRARMAHGQFVMSEMHTGSVPPVLAAAQHAKLPPPVRAVHTVSHGQELHAAAGR